MRRLVEGDTVLVTSLRGAHTLASSPEGVVTALDDGGVHVRFDEPINGVDTAYATYNECVVVRAAVAWADRHHTDPYCATHCRPGIKHSQCGCPCNHQSTNLEDNRVHHPSSQSTDQGVNG